MYYYGGYQGYGCGQPCGGYSGGGYGTGYGAAIILVLFIFSHEDQFRKLRTNLSFGCS